MTRLLLVGARLRGRLRVYPLSIAVLAGTEGPACGMVAVTLFDIDLTWLAWRQGAAPQGFRAVRPRALPVDAHNHRLGTNELEGA